MVQDSIVRYLNRKAKITDRTFEPINIDFEICDDEWANGLMYVRVALKLLKLDATQMATVAAKLRGDSATLPELIEDLGEAAHLLKSLAEACAAARERISLLAER